MEPAPSFFDFLSQAELRYLQARLLGLDLYHAGWAAWVAAALLVASATVFFLAIFHLLRSPKAGILLLIALGSASFGFGLLASYLGFLRLQEGAAAIHPHAGVPPHTPGQEAAVIAFPALLGLATLLANALGCLYIAIFWTSGHLVEAEAPPKRPSKRAAR